MVGAQAGVGPVAWTRKHIVTAGGPERVRRSTELRPGGDDFAPARASVRARAVTEASHAHAGSRRASDSADVAPRAQVTIQTMDAILLPLQAPVFAWLRERDIPAAGPPFWKFNVIDMDRLLEVEVGVPVTAPVDGDDRVLAGVLPAGGYATLRYNGHPDGPIGAIASPREWARQEGLTRDMTNTQDGERWAARLEIYETDPTVEPDMTKSRWHASCWPGRRC